MVESEGAPDVRDRAYAACSVAGRVAVPGKATASELEP
jgi:hypothetical protein